MASIDKRLEDNWCLCTDWDRSRFRCPKFI